MSDLSYRQIGGHWPRTRRETWTNILLYGVGWGGVALLYALSFVWHPFFYPAAGLLVGLAVMYGIVFAGGTVFVVGRALLESFGLEIRRKR